MEDLWVLLFSLSGFGTVLLQSQRLTFGLFVTMLMQLLRMLCDKVGALLLDNAFQFFSEPVTKQVLRTITKITSRLYIITRFSQAFNIIIWEYNLEMPLFAGHSENILIPAW